MGVLSRTLSTTMGALSPNEIVMLEKAREGVREIVDQVNRVFSGSVLEYSDKLIDYGYSPFSGFGQIRIPEEVH